MIKENIKVEFEYRYDDQLGWNEDNTSPYISMSDPESSVIGQRSPDEIVIPFKTIRVLYTYPLENSVIYTFEAVNGEGFTRAELARKIASGYQRIYREEDEAVGVTGNINQFMLNRAQSHGPFGIWGHHIGDLVLHTVRQQSGNLFTLGVDS